MAMPVTTPKHIAQALKGIEFFQVLPRKTVPPAELSGMTFIEIPPGRLRKRKKIVKTTKSKGLIRHELAQIAQAKKLDLDKKMEQKEHEFREWKIEVGKAKKPVPQKNARGVVPDRPKERIVRPPAEYSNSSPYGIAHNYLNGQDKE